MIKNPRNLLWIIPLFLFLSSPLWKPSVTSFLKPRGGYDASSVGKDRQATQNFSMDSLTLTMTSKGRKTWVVKAESAFTGKTDGEIDMVGVDALYTGGGPDKTLITSKRGRYNISASHLVLMNNVIVRKPAARQVMKTEILNYYDKDKMVVSPVKVDLKGPDFSILAGRMDYDLISHGYDFGGRVRCRF